MKPNIIIFNPDQMRRDALAHLGNRAAITPNLDRFASCDAVSFSNAYCQNPVCVPSRCSFLTGRYPHVNGHRTMSYMLHEEETSLLSELKEAGFDVWMNARNDFLPAREPGAFERHATEIFYGGDVPDSPGTINPNPRGKMGEKDFYSFYFGELAVDDKGKNYTSDDEAVDKAVEKIKTRAADQPFCLFIGLQLPHPPYQIEEPYFSAIDKTKLPQRFEPPEDYDGKPAILKRIAELQQLEGLSEEDWSKLRSSYLGMCMKTDELFEKICTALKEEGIYDDTAIFVLSDHGDYTGDYGLVEKTQNTFEDCLVNVPLLIKPQKGVPIDPGRSDSLVELIDFYATVMDLCEVKPDHSQFGKSLKPQLANRAEKNREYVFSEGGRLAGEIHCNESNGREQNPYDLYYPRKMAQLDDICHSKATMIRSERYKYIRRLYEPDELYDLEKDPAERFNQIDNPEYAGVLGNLRMEMLEWYQSTCDAVPFRQDDRFNYEMIWNRVKMNCPKEIEEEVKEKIRNGLDMFRLIAWIKQYKRDQKET